MRILAVTRGVPASGKSTWIEQMGFKPYSLSPDDLRLLYSGIKVGINGQKSISQASDRFVWDNIHKALEERMKRGIFTVVDATCTKESDIAFYDKLANKYRYRLVIVDFSNVSREECIKRNENRTPEWKKVPNSVIDTMFERFKTPLKSKYASLLCKPEEFKEKFEHCTYYNIDNYKKVVVFGDIHSCFAPIKQYFDKNPYTEDCFYVFTGDYIDRGPNAVEVVRFLCELKDKPNVVMLIGNHEKHIEKLIMEGNDLNNIGYARETIKTIKSLSDEQFKELKEIVRKCRISYCFEFDGKKYIATHAGVPGVIDNFSYSSDDIIKGIGTYEEIDEIDQNFSKSSNGVISIHAHRNVECKSPIKSSEYTYNLCDDIENGGFLRVLELEKNGIINENKIKNDIYIKKTQLLENVDVVSRLLSSDGVKVRDLGCGISSFSFTKDVFFDNKFDSLSTKARGLFIANEESPYFGRVIARSYPKFFNVYADKSWTDKNNDEFEFKDAPLDSIKDKLQFPVKAYLKENGFLGILSWDSINEKFFVSSKNYNSGDFAGYFESIITPKLSNELKNYLCINNVSMIFEVVDMKNDGVHMIDYGKDTRFVVLLDIVHNDFTDSFESYEEVKSAGEKFGFITKKEINTFTDWEQLKSFICGFEDVNNTGSEYDTKSTDGIEGFVFEDDSGYRFKYKTAFYRKWKNLRKILEKLKLNKRLNNVKYNQTDADVVNFMLNYKIQKDTTIIEIRREYNNKKEIPNELLSR